MIGAMRTTEDGRWYRLSLGALVLSAWGVLAVWSASPFAGLIDHRESVAQTALSPILRAGIFTAGWALMTVAMMLPGSLPLINLFRRVAGARANPARSMALLLLGYVGMWTVFGLVAYLGDVQLHEAVERLPQLAPWIGVTTLLAAGTYQFTPLKNACLNKCRSPYSFLVEHWRGRRVGWEAVRLGVRHGLFCVGCCWSLMLLMFAVGGANFGWMLLLGAFMAAERTTQWGKHLTRPLGVALVVWALLIATGKATFPGA